MNEAVSLDTFSNKDESLSNSNASNNTFKQLGLDIASSLTPMEKTNPSIPNESSRCQLLIKSFESVLTFDEVDNAENDFCTIEMEMSHPVYCKMNTSTLRSHLVKFILTVAPTMAVPVNLYFCMIVPLMASGWMSYGRSWFREAYQRQN